MFLDITPDLLAEGDVLGQGTADDLVKGPDVRRHGCREEKHKAKLNVLKDHVNGGILPPAKALFMSRLITAILVTFGEMSDRCEPLTAAHSLLSN